MIYVMTTSSTKKKPSPPLTVAVRTTQYGSLEPLITLTTPAGMTAREARAAQLQLAAQVELASAAARWIVSLSQDVFYVGSRTATVYLELSEGTPEELAAAEQVLRAIAGGK